MMFGESAQGRERPRTVASRAGDERPGYQAQSRSAL